jgi:hypothetical protein
MKITDLEVRNQLHYQENLTFFKKLKEKPITYIGFHGKEKAMLKNIDLEDPKEIELATSGDFIEYQTGKNLNEFKFILQNIRNGEPLHYVFLNVPSSDISTLVNIYNPTEGMSFKWSKDGRKRIYLNNFRSCCPHPLDDIENYNKEHHGKNHKKYDYQLTNGKNSKF